MSSSNGWWIDGNGVMWEWVGGAKPTIAHDPANGNMLDIVAAKTDEAVKGLERILAEKIYPADTPGQVIYVPREQVRFRWLRAAYWRIRVAVTVLVCGFDINPCPYCDNDSEYD